MCGQVSQNGFGCPMILTADCKLNPHTRRYPAACKANVSECKRTWQARDDAGNLPCKHRNDRLQSPEDKTPYRS